MTVSLKAQNYLILNKARLRVTLLSDSAVILKQARKFDRVVLAIIAPVSYTHLRAHET